MIIVLSERPINRAIKLVILLRQEYMSRLYSYCITLAPLRFLCVARLYLCVPAEIKIALGYWGK